MSSVKSEVIEFFDLHGFKLKSDACNYVCELLLPLSNENRITWLEKFIDYLQNESLSISLIDKALLENAAKEFTENELGRCNVMNIIDVFSLPHLKYNTETKKISISYEKNYSLFGNADDKHKIFVERHELFSPISSSLYLQDADKKYALKPIEYLLGTTSMLGDIIVFGMITQLKDGKYFLEDPTGIVEMDLKETFHTGLFLENCYVLCEGSYEEQLFSVRAMGFPPIETAEETRAYFGNLNFFGGPSKVSVKTDSVLLNFENLHPEIMMVFISDVWLDKEDTMSNLRKLFVGFSQCPPYCFVFCGNFLSLPQGAKYAEKLCSHLSLLGKLLKEFSNLITNSKFIFLSGPNEPSIGNIIPRPPLLNYFTNDLKQMVPSAEFTTNPCRLQYCTKEIVIFREDLVTKMCRNCIYFPTDGDIPAHFLKTITSQCHLCPLPLTICPIYWSHDTALRLYPLPDLLVCADRFNHFTIQHQGFTITNPGSFSQNKGCFKVYYPTSGQVEDSQI